MTDLTTGVRLSTDMHSKLKERKALIAEILDVPERKVTFEDAFRSFVYPEDWTGIDVDEIQKR